MKEESKTYLSQYLVLILIYRVKDPNNHRLAKSKHNINNYDTIITLR